MRQATCILFDNDGTLVDTHDLILDSFQYATSKLLGRAVTDEEVMATGGQPLNTQMAIFAQGDAELAAELSRVYREHNHAIHDERVKLFDGVQEGLQQLKDAGIALGVVTSKRHWLAWHGLEVTGVAGYFDCCIGVDDCEQHKPHPGPLLLGAKQLGAEPASCVYLGDSPFDMQAANNAGFTSAAALWGMFSHEQLAAENPDLYCTSFGDFVEAILGR